MYVPKSSETNANTAQTIMSGLVELSQDYNDVNHRIGSVRRSREDNAWTLGEAPLHFTTHAEGQLLARLNIVASYLHRCPNWLQADNVNYWVSQYANKEVMLRQLRSANLTRAVFSTRYSSEMDDHKVFPVVFNSILSDSDNPHIGQFNKSEDFTCLYVDYPSMSVEKEGARCVAGIAVVNSEVGISAFQVRPVVWVHTETRSFSFLDTQWDGVKSFRHMGDIKTDAILKAIHNSKEVAQIGIYNVLRAQKEIITKPFEVLADFAKTTPVFTKSILDMLKDEYEDQEAATRLQLAQSIVATVSDLPIFKRHQMEREAGRFMSLFGSSRSILADVVAQIGD